MGLLDDVLGKVKKAVGGTGVEEPNLVNEVPGILPGAGEGGGLQGLIQTLTDKGLGDIVSSWVGTGQNLPISAGQLKTGLAPA